MDLPKDFSSQDQANIVAVRIAAREDFAIDPYFSRGLMHPPGYNETEENGKRLQDYILAVFYAFAVAACNLARENIWSVKRVEDETHHFLYDFTCEARVEYSHLHFPGTTSGPIIEPRLMQKFRESTQWKKFQQMLKILAEEQAAHPVWPRIAQNLLASSKPDRIETEPSPMANSGVERDGQHRVALLEAYRLATGASNHKIYNAKNSHIHKPQFYQWLNGTLPATSQTAINFERFLREMKPPIPKR